MQSNTNISMLRTLSSYWFRQILQFQIIFINSENWPISLKTLKYCPVKKNES
jgi:hypothetical protein